MSQVENCRLPSKKERILSMWSTIDSSAGSTQRIIESIAEKVGSRPTYVAQVLRQAGHAVCYFDLYTSNEEDQNVHTSALKGVLSFKSIGHAASSVARMDELFQHYGRTGDRAGQHAVMTLALTGMNRARWSGKPEESKVFRRWLEKV